MDPEDRRHMRRALELAERGRGTTAPNPLVGCVLIRDGHVVGEGWHERAGGPHAEIVALRQAGPEAEGATAYVTLEPCAHQGRTGPCAPALLDAGIRRVVYGVADPNLQAAGGAGILRDGGVEVSSGVLADEVERQNEEFLLVQRAGRPFVTLKLAQSLDGGVATAEGDSRWITSEPARRRVHELRGQADAVMVGSGTVLADDPRLDVRHVDQPRGQPRPVVLDRRGRTPPDATVVRDGALIVTSELSDEAWRHRLDERGVEVVVLERAAGRDVALRGALPALLARDVRTVLCEGGPTLAAALVTGDLVDRLVLHVAPTLLGGDGLPSVAGLGVSQVEAAPRWQLDELTRYGPDVELVLRPIHGGG